MACSSRFCWGYGGMPPMSSLKRLAGLWCSFAGVAFCACCRHSRPAKLNPVASLQCFHVSRCSRKREARNSSHLFAGLWRSFNHDLKDHLSMRSYRVSAVGTSAHHD